MSMGWGPAAGIAAGGFGWDDGVATQADHGVQVGWPLMSRMWPAVQSACLHKLLSKCCNLNSAELPGVKVV